MKKGSILQILALIFSAVFMSSALAQETPKTMTKISIRGVEPAPKPGSFEARPKIFWRAGTRYARIAESPDPQQRIHGLIIIKEPDIWMINLFDNSGRHMIDPGPSLNVHIPVFPQTTKTKLDELELGKELEFFTKNNATLSSGETVGGTGADRYEVTVGDRKLVLWTDAKSKRPVRISVVAGEHTQTIEYLAYEEKLSFDPLLFQPPAGIVIGSVK